MVKQLNSCKAFYDYNFLQWVKAVIDENGLIIPQKCTEFEYYNALGGANDL